MGIPMFIAKTTEKNCCTCHYWNGTRVTEGDGYIYSLKSLEGICDGTQQRAIRPEFNLALTFPDGGCNAWEKWLDIEMGE